MKLVVGVMLTLGAIAHADPAPSPAAPAPPPSVAPDSAAERAGDANLESIAVRKGVTASIALGGALTVGFGINDSVGRGGVGSLRLGETMSENSVLTVELLFGAVAHEVPGMDLVTNNDTNFLIGVQYFLGPSLFVRIAGGIGDYIRNKEDVAGNGVLSTRKVAGPAGVIGGGLEFIHARHISLDFEIFLLGMPNRDGFLSTSALCIGGSYY